ncbi:MAG TPA: SRPBCC family protein [Nocardioidaceae bacterium]|nr:SRPBCC family protein [Nocardioidaceae bacterium]
MSEISRVMDCSPQAVFDVLSDGWTYATWVVGAARIRSVDESFPAPGAKIHHSVGLWPALINDDTEVDHVHPPHELQLRVRAWPTGEGEVRIVCEPEGDKTRVTIHETAVTGPARLVPKPVEDAMLRVRNTETLKRLAYLAESGARSKHGPHE